MKKILALASAAAIFLAAAIALAIPRPMVIYYGQACDAYGQVYRDNAEIFLMEGTNEVARFPIDGPLAPGVNFVLYAPYDGAYDDLENYVPNAINGGDRLDIWVSDLDGERKVTECVVPVVEEAGSIIRLRVMAGEDNDGDGMLDAWERANGLNPNDPSDADTDLDGDGASNIHEFLAGTLANNPYDVFAATLGLDSANDVYAISFPTAYGKVYRIETAPLRVESNAFPWTEAEFATSASASADRQSYAIGEDGYLTIYLPASTMSNSVWRLAITDE